MFLGSFALADTVRTVRVGHELKLLIVFNEFVEQHFGIVVVYVVVSGAVYVEQVSFQVFGIGNRRSVYNIFQIFLRQPHVALLVNVVVGKLVGHGCDRNSCFINFGILKQQI